MKKLQIYRDGAVKTIKPGITEDDLRAGGYFERHPGAIMCKHKPSIATMERWSDDGIAQAVDGCRVEPDGHCPHGCPSWLLVMRVI